ncbi:bifunctional acetate--CoA ligase family protein/GNAT family N-acetyltransferase [Massilia sp. IC2-476]|uniref:bifunctional acetate--CoA ligase family protein/GNAT family N-acetyltransferase n=1 Tax=Massilia sp. IC2-476 TaxID=2887199 RepID=UPI001D0FFB23|nr:bifunctional acetate--CoA ligase family protein/GNAT family N-acetyltransferase [Massilia sp. IC2-476]MCC2972507.1 bifunctional acetate--CoA ligase family protein/GNAT family N-acetyltransferase [Massilia sp. IC2-476]
MSVRNLEHLFAPGSVALVGASERPGSLGATLLHNLLAGGFKGEVWPVNPKYTELSGRRCYASVAELPQAPSLAVICTPPATVPAIVRQLGERGTRAAVVLSQGLVDARRGGRSLRQAMLDAAHPYLLRLLGPNSAGLLTPGLGLNASVATSGALPGRIAFVSQSGALMVGVLDWARTRGIGFSHFIALGDAADVDLGDVLDYLASDGATGAILLYLQDLRYARKFMSAARAAARSKPVLVLKAGREEDDAPAAASESGALAHHDDVFDAAIRRAGMLRVYTTDQLFSAAETLAYARPLHGERLAIVSNGAGPGVLARDALAYGGGVEAQFAGSTIDRLDALLAPRWRRGNVVDLQGGAPPALYREALEILLQDPQVDAVLAIQSPTATVSSRDVADAIAPLVRSASKTLLSCWLGGAAVAEARAIASGARLPAFRTPEDAVAGFLQLVHYRRNQNLLMEVPPSMAGTVAPDRAAARALVREAIAAGRYLLSDPETKAILRTYGMAVVETRQAATVDEAVQAAQNIGYPVAVKILTPDVMHKSDFGGVTLDIDSPEGVRAAAKRMTKRLGELFPQARFEGYSVQAMARSTNAHELIVGAALDPVFGPVIVFGQGGVTVEVTDDHAVGLPPLNLVLARDLVDRTRVARLLAGYRNRPAVNMDAVLASLVQVSRMVADIPEIVELDLNPLLADSRGTTVLDARMRLALADRSGSTLDRLAIRPYPRELEETIEWNGGTLLLRPIRPEDGPAHLAFFDALTPDDVRYRMFVRIRELQPSQLARFTQIDYDREMAFIATRPNAQGVAETLAVGRVVADPDNISAEFAVTVRSDLKGMGLGKIMMQKLIDYCRSRGTREIVGEALPQNSRITGLAKRMGFTVKSSGLEGMREMRLVL